MDIAYFVWWPLNGKIDINTALINWLWLHECCPCILNVDVFGLINSWMLENFCSCWNVLNILGIFKTRFELLYCITRKIITHVCWGLTDKTTSKYDFWDTWCSKFMIFLAICNVQFHQKFIIIITMYIYSPFVYYILDSICMYSRNYIYFINCKHCELLKIKCKF